MNEKMKTAVSELQMNGINLEGLNLDFDKCSMNFILTLSDYIRQGNDPQKMIEVCGTLFPDNPTNVPEGYGLPVTLITKSGNINSIKQAINDGECEMSPIGLLFENLYQSNRFVAEKTKCGRMCYDTDKFSMGLYGMDIFMSEGSEEVFNLYTHLKHTCNNTHKEMAIPDVMFGHLQPGFNFEMELDDMNIRGIQIKYAFEYTDGNADTLVELIMSRDKDLINYINKRVVEEFDNATWRYKDCLAVTCGASFDKTDSSFRIWVPFKNPLHTKFDPLLDDRQEIINKANSHHVAVDYSKLDITRATNMNDGVKIAEAHGFEMLRCEDIKNSDLTDIFMISKDRSAFLHARAKKDDTMAYGGCDVMAVGCKNTLSTGFGFGSLHCNSECFGDNISRENPYSDYRIYECSYNEGCFTQYAAVKDRFPVKFEKIPWEQAPVTGIAYLPVPEVIDFKSMYQREKWYHVLPVRDINMVLYHVKRLVNIILFVREVYPDLPEDVRDVYRAYKDPYEVVAKVCGYFDRNETVAAIGIAFQYLNLPQDEEDKYLSTIKTSLLNEVKGSFDEKHEISLINKKWPDIKGKGDTWVELLKLFVPDYELSKSTDGVLN